MDKAQLAAKLNYPEVWLSSGLYCDDLYLIQKSDYEREYGAEQPLGGTEHWRYGAFHYWIRLKPSPETLSSLMEAAIADPDEPMAGAAMKDILRCPGSTRALLERALSVVITSEDYYCSATQLESALAENSSSPQAD